MSDDGPKGLESFPDPRELRNLWFASLSQAMDGYMRSAAFLEWMRHALRVMTESQALQAAAWSSALPRGPALPASTREKHPALSDPGS